MRDRIGRQPLIIALFIVFTGVAAPAEASSYQNVEPLLTTDLYYDTFASDPNRLRRFELTTTAGTLTGVVATSGDKTTVVLSGQTGSFEMTLTPSAGSADVDIRVEDGSGGNATIQLGDAGRVVVDNGFDCVGYQSSAFYNELVKASIEYAAVLPSMGLDPIADSPYVQVFELAIGVPVRIPGYLGCAEPNEPQAGICVVEGTWQQCVECCDTETNISASIGVGLSILAAITTNPLTGAAAIPFGAPNDCISRICEGKAGDQTPTFCVYSPPDVPGYCATACPQQNANSDGCEGSWVCCPAALVYCPGPYEQCGCDLLDPNDPDCGW